MLAWKNEDPYDAVFNPDGRTIYKRMMTALFNTPNLNKLTNEDLTRMFGNGHSMNDEQNVDEVKIKNSPRLLHKPHLKILRLAKVKWTVKIHCRTPS